MTEYSRVSGVPKTDWVLTSAWSTKSWNDWELYPKLKWLVLGGTGTLTKRVLICGTAGIYQAQTSTEACAIFNLMLLRYTSTSRLEQQRPELQGRSGLDIYFVPAAQSKSFVQSHCCVEYSPKVATQMARDHARLTPVVDTPLLHIILSPVEWQRLQRHQAWAWYLRQCNYPQKNPRTIISPQEYGTP